MGRRTIKPEPSVTITGLPSWQLPYIQRMMGEAQALYGRPIRYYPSETVAGFTPLQREAMTGIVERARMGSPLTREAQSLLGRTIAGEFVGANPMLQRYLEEALPAVTTTATQAGRYGGGIQGLLTGRAIGEAIAQTYEPERTRQFAAMQLAPQFAELDYRDLGRLAMVGEAERELAQEQIDALIKKWQFEQLEPWQRLEMYRDLISGAYGGETVARPGTITQKMRLW